MGKEKKNPKEPESPRHSTHNVLNVALNECVVPHVERFVHSQGFAPENHHTRKIFFYLDRISIKWKKNIWAGCRWKRILFSQLIHIIASMVCINLTQRYLACAFLMSIRPSFGAWRTILSWLGICECDEIIHGGWLGFPSPLRTVWFSNRNII